MQISDFLLGDTEGSGKYQVTHYCVAVERESGIVGIAGDMKDPGDAYSFMDLDDAIEHMNECQDRYECAMFIVSYDGYVWRETDTGATFKPSINKESLVLQKMIRASQAIDKEVIVEASVYYPDFGSW